MLRAGNFFFAGARLFFRSLEAAIFLFSRVARIPEGSLVLPAICTEERITLGAELANGSVIRGQNEISHPSAPGRALSLMPSLNDLDCRNCTDCRQHVLLLCCDEDHSPCQVCAQTTSDEQSVVSFRDQ